MHLCHGFKTRTRDPTQSRPSPSQLSRVTWDMAESDRVPFNSSQKNSKIRKKNRSMRAPSDGEFVKPSCFCKFFTILIQSNHFFQEISTLPNRKLGQVTCASVMSFHIGEMSPRVEIRWNKIIHMLGQYTSI